MIRNPDKNGEEEEEGGGGGRRGMGDGEPDNQMEISNGFLHLFHVEKDKENEEKKE